MKRYTITVNVATATATIKNNETGKVVVGKVGKYHRNTEVKYEIRFDKTEVGCENNGIVQIPKQNNKFLKVFEHDLTKKQATAIEESDFTSEPRFVKEWEL